MRIFEIENADLEDVITDKCFQAYGYWKTAPLFRGTDGKPNMFLGTIRQDRKPLGSSPDEVAVFDYWMKKNSLPFRKSNTLSVSVSKSQASVYTNHNNVYQIFPFDGAKYMGTRLRDLLFVYTAMERLYFKKFNTQIIDYFGFIDDYLDYINEDLKLTVSEDHTKIPSPGELLVYGTQYVAKKIDPYA